MKSIIFKNTITLILFLVGTVILIGASFSEENNFGQQQIPVKDKAKSLEAFKTIVKVLKHPRCMNCHPTGDSPRQGDDQHVHLFNVTRGTDNHGGPVQKCETCHHKENNPYTNVPGAPHWGLAPKSMGWFGLSDAEIGQRLMNRVGNGGRTPLALVEHMTKDSLVLWGWNPGGTRTPVDVPFEEFESALNAWLANGAHVPELEVE